jgi:hypothetical protein
MLLCSERLSSNGRPLAPAGVLPLGALRALNDQTFPTWTTRRLTSRTVVQRVGDRSELSDREIGASRLDVRDVGTSSSAVAARAGPA